MEIRFDNGEFQIPADQIEAINRGAAYRELEKSVGYHQLLDYLEKRSDMALKALRESDLRPDSEKIALQMIWREREKMLEDMQIEVQRTISAGKEIAGELDRNVLIHFDAPIDFGGNDGENN